MGTTGITIQQAQQISALYAEYEGLLGIQSDLENAQNQNCTFTSFTVSNPNGGSQTINLPTLDPTTVANIYSQMLTDIGTSLANILSQLSQM